MHRLCYVGSHSCPCITCGIRSYFLTKKRSGVGRELEMWPGFAFQQVYSKSLNEDE